MTDEEPRPPLRFASLEGDPDASAAGTPDEPDDDPLQTLKNLWHLFRLLLTVSAIAAGGFLSSCGTFIAASQLARTPLGPSSRSAPGVVVGHKRSGHGTRRFPYVYAPIVRFTVDGRDFEITSDLATNERVPVGERVQVRYEPATPQRAVLVGWAEWGMPVEFMAIGGPLLAFGILCWRRRWWRRPDAWW
jgi:uncharacterized protein DUF3592